MIEVQALGGLRVLRDGDEVIALRASPLRAALLVYLAVERDVARERLCSLLWPDSTPERARRSLSQALYELRKDLGDEWVETSGEHLTATRQLETDVDELDRAISEGRDFDSLSAYRGPFLDGAVLGGGVEYEHWAEGRRSEIHGRVRRLYRTVVQDVHDPEERVRLAREWVRLDPLDDEAQHALIESLALAGDRTASLEQFQSYSDLIGRELEVEPLEHTTDLVERIKAGTFGPAELDRTPDAPGVTVPEREVATDDEGGEGSAALHLEPGLVVSRMIGRGATGSVYLAREPALKRLVAVKVLDAEMAANPTARARFEREAQSAAKVVHPNVAAVHRVGTTEDGRPYLVMPYVKGGTLRDRMKALGPLPPEEVRRLLREAASALAAAHAVGVIHRDVRPANFLYEEETGRTYLADFGVAGVLESGTTEIANLTRTGELLGNVEYISPEQARGDEVDDRSDVYSLGILGRALLFGNPLPPADDDRCPDRRLVDILDRATARQPRHRPSAAQLVESLSGASSASPGERGGLLSALLRRLGR